jgi:hypothetical protein
MLPKKMIHELHEIHEIIRIVPAGRPLSEVKIFKDLVARKVSSRIHFGSYLMKATQLRK